VKKVFAIAILVLTITGSAKAVSPENRIVIDKSLHVIVMYDKDNKPVQYYPISCGTFDKPTKEGDLFVVYKKRDPYWLPINWDHYPEYFKDPTPIEPYRENKGNPLGTTFTSLNWADFGIHGTNAPLCIGRHISSGCVRMHIPDNEKFFPLIEDGMQVKIKTEEKIPWRIAEAYSSWWGVYDIVNIARRIESTEGDK
jgi:lipoprotein-anchoring transpeptidase ErfK/SrfK